MSSASQKDAAEESARKARELLAEAWDSSTATGDRSDFLREAQVHATLALVHATLASVK